MFCRRYVPASYLRSHQCPFFLNVSASDLLSFRAWCSSLIYSLTSDIPNTLIPYMWVKFSLLLSNPNKRILVVNAPNYTSGHCQDLGLVFLGKFGCRHFWLRVGLKGLMTCGLFILEGLMCRRRNCGRVIFRRVATIGTDGVGWRGQSARAREWTSFRVRSQLWIRSGQFRFQKKRRKKISTYFLPE